MRAQLQIATNRKLVEFLNRVPDIDSSLMTCDVDLVERKTNVIESNGRNDRYFMLNSLHTKFLMPYLNLIAKCCNQLKIKSFYELPASLSLTSLPKNRKLAEMKYVKCLDIECNVGNSSLNCLPDKRGNKNRNI